MPIKSGSECYNVLFVSSAGGVLLDLLALKPWWSSHKTTWAVVRAADTASYLAGQDVFWVKERQGSHPWTIVAGVFDAVRILRSCKPDCIISAGSGVAAAFFLVARIIRIPTFWIETFNMVGDGGVTSRICTTIATEIIVQREKLLQRFPRAILIGELY